MIVCVWLSMINCLTVMPDSLPDKHTDLSSRDDLDDSILRDTMSIASTDSFVSAAEVRMLTQHPTFTPNP